ncbi:helix-hairpin-helix domain-containing protein [Ensifer adhaerens]|nr:helix-hairpin-helix domain-containing protein [Ensifer adhaerens]UTV38125.1 helix-hairpin-helix domain-containing protein [Ensifer adhaerens]
MTTKLSDLMLRNPKLLAELRRRGYDTAEDMQHVSTTDALRMMGMGSKSWQKICDALGRDPART